MMRSLASTVPPYQHETRFSGHFAGYDNDGTMKALFDAIMVVVRLLVSFLDDHRDSVARRAVDEFQMTILVDELIDLVRDLKIIVGKTIRWMDAAESLAEGMVQAVGAVGETWQTLTFNRLGYAPG